MTSNQEYFLGCIKYPSSWNTGLELYQYLDTPMNMLFQGICNSILEMYYSYFKQYKVRTKFLDTYFTIYEEVKDNELSILQN